MEQKMNRVVRGCIESASGNPLCSIHDQGAGGNGKHIKFFRYSSLRELYLGLVIAWGRGLNPTNRASFVTIPLGKKVIVHYLVSQFKAELKA